MGIENESKKEFKTSGQDVLIVFGTAMACGLVGGLIVKIFPNINTIGLIGSCAIILSIGFLIGTNWINKLHNEAEEY